MASEVLGRLRSLTQQQQRKAAAILGALVADAAAVPLHWIYDQDKVNKLSDNGAKFAFLSKSHCPFYTISTGLFSAYGDQLFVTLQAIADKKGIDLDYSAELYYKNFGPGTPYEDARKQKAEKVSPVIGPWTNGSVRTFVDQYGKKEKPYSNASSVDPDGTTRSIVAIALLAGKPDLLPSVRSLVEMMQSNKIAVGFALASARILEQFILKSDGAIDAALKQLKDPNRACPHEGEKDAVKAIEKAVSEAGNAHVPTVKANGLACGYPNSYVGSVHGIVSQPDYTSAVKQGILAAGDNCSRLIFTGACVGARGGLDAIPEEWINQMTNAKTVLECIETVVQL